MAKGKAGQRRDVDDGLAPDAPDEALLTEIRERFDYATAEWSEIRKEGSTDMRFVAGDPWDEADRAARKGRPTVAPDELHQYYNAVVNDLRGNPRGIRYAATGDGANDESARWYEEKARETEYRSQAQAAYITAAENAVHRSYGYIEIATEYETERSFNQDAWVREIANPDMVLPDPASTNPREWSFLFKFEPLPVTEFERQHPKARIKDFALYADIAPAWVRGDDTIIRAEYWRVELEEAELLLYANGSTLFADEAAKRTIDLPVVKRRASTRRKVRRYLTNGCEILERTDWPGAVIPFGACYGKVIYVDGRRVILSMTRAMREPWKLYCYYRSQQAEMAGMVPKVPVQGYEGQFRGHELKWRKARSQPVDFLEFKGKTKETGDVVLPPPARLDYNAGEHLQALELCAEGARRSVQSAAGSGFLPTSAQRRNEKSGVALQRIDENSQRGSFHFVDHYDALIQFAGEVLEDVFDKVYDTARDVGVRKADGTSAIVRINDQRHPQSVSTKGKHLTTVSTGPSYDSEREAASAFADSIVTNGGFIQVLGPQKGAKFLALAIRLRNVGPLGDQMAEIVDPKPMQQGKPLDPAQAQAMMMAAKSEIDALRAALQDCQEALKTRVLEKRLELQTKKELALLEMTNAKEVEQIRAEAGLGAAVIKTSSDQAIAQLEARLEDISRIVDAQAAALDRAHEVGLEAMRHQQTLDQAAHGAGLAGAQAQDDAAMADEAAAAAHDRGLEGQAFGATMMPAGGAGEATL